MNEYIKGWIEDPASAWELQDVDLILWDALSVSELRNLLRSTIPVEKKKEVVSALVEGLEHDLVKDDGSIDFSILKDISDTLREHSDVCRRAIPNLGVGNDDLLRCVIETDFPHGFDKIARAEPGA